MKVSVIIPTWNRAALVREAVASVLDQSLRDFELIVVDDGSSDTTVAELARIDHPRFRLLERAHEGMPRAWHAGLDAARGEYVLTLGSDDRLLAHCLATLVRVADTRPEAVVVYGRARAIARDGAPLPQLAGAPAPFPGRFLLSLVHGDFVAETAALVRRTALAAFERDPDLTAAEDWDLWLQLARVGGFVFVDEVLAEFRLHGGRSTGSTPAAVHRLAVARKRVLDRAFARGDLPADVAAARATAYRNLHVDLGLRWAAAGCRTEARASFASALAGGAPRAATLARIAYLWAFYRLVLRSPAVTRLSDAVARRRRALRLAADRG